MAQKSHRTTSSSVRHQPPPRRRKKQPLFQRAWLGISAIMLMICGVIGFSVTLGAAVLLRSSPSEVGFEVVETDRVFYAESPVGPEASSSPLSVAFTPEVQYWEPLIKAWAVVYQVDPNLIATVIQIESCGDPTVSSWAGAQGLFQVMPFHFDQGEDMLDVQTNARRGLDYLMGSLDRADDHAGLGAGRIQWRTWGDQPGMGRVGSRNTALLLLGSTHLRRNGVWHEHQPHPSRVAASRRTVSLRHALTRPNRNLSRMQTTGQCPQSTILTGNTGPLNKPG